MDLILFLIALFVFGLMVGVLARMVYVRLRTTDGSDRVRSPGRFDRATAPPTRS